MTFHSAIDICMHRRGFLKYDLTWKQTTDQRVCTVNSCISVSFELPPKSHRNSVDLVLKVSPKSGHICGVQYLKFHDTMIGHHLFLQNSVWGFQTEVNVHPITKINGWVHMLSPTGTSFFTLHKPHNTMATVLKGKLPWIALFVTELLLTTYALIKKSFSKTADVEILQANIAHFHALNRYRP